MLYAEEAVSGPFSNSSTARTLYNAKISKKITTNEYNSIIQLCTFLAYYCINCPYRGRWKSDCCRMVVSLIKRTQRLNFTVTCLEAKTFSDNNINLALIVFYTFVRIKPDYYCVHVAYIVQGLQRFVWIQVFFFS